MPLEDRTFHTSRTLPHSPEAVKHIVIPANEQNLDRLARVLANASKA